MKSPPTERGGRSLLIVVRVAVLTVAAAAVVGAVVWTHGARPPVAADVVHVCPMHVEVTSTTPGDCPICRMALELRQLGGRTGASRRTGPTERGRADAVVLPRDVIIPAVEAIEYGGSYETARELRAPAWADSVDGAQALLFKDEIAGLEPAEAAHFLPAIDPDRSSFAGVPVVRLDEPPRPRDEASAWVRVRAVGARRLRPGQTGWLKFAAKVRPFRAVRASAVLRSSGGARVLVLGDDDRTFIVRPVSIGSVTYGQAAVLGGLVAGDRVVTAHAYALDAERRLGEGMAESAVGGQGATW